VGLTNSIRVGELQLMRVEDVIHAGGCPLLQGTMQNDQGLLGHAGVHENMYPASKVPWMNKAPIAIKVSLR